MTDNSPTNNALKKFNKMKLVLITFHFSIGLIQANGQEFYQDGTMKLTEFQPITNTATNQTTKNFNKSWEDRKSTGYLKALRGPNGERIQFRRVASCCEFKSKSAAFGSGFLDKYEVYYQRLSTPVFLYLDGYDFESPLCPVGFTFVTADKIEKPVVYPADSILKVNFCNPKATYAVKEFLLKEEIGDLPEPATSPTFDGGIEELKKYFVERPLTDEQVKDIVFRVLIAFVVDCNGNAGNFMIITKGKGVAETFANQVLERVNKMPQNWKPATKDGEKVDSYQVLSFTVTSGQLDKVSYR